MSSVEKKIILKEGREKSLLRRHPWIFSGAISKTVGDPSCGDTVSISTAGGQFLGRGAYSPKSQISVRVWDWDENTQIDKQFFKDRIQQAYTSRHGIFQPDSVQAIRIIHGESDNLPGLIVDKYGEWLVVQFLSCGPEYWRKDILDALISEIQPKGIYERSDVDVRELEGLQSRTGLLWGEAFPKFLEINQHNLKFLVDVFQGHKTGYYLDQRENHMLIQNFSQGKDLLDCFCYSGSFSVEALAGGANSVTAVDASAEALALAGENMALNECDLSRVLMIQADVFQLLRKMRDERRSFDLIVLDPPKFAPTSAQVQKAARGYKDINLLALKLLRPGGILFTFSCSGGVDMLLFQKILAGAALDAKVNAKIIQYLHQARDHPIGLAFPEGEYLKGLIIQKC